MLMQQCQQECLKRPANGFMEHFGRQMQRFGKWIERCSQFARQRRQLLEMDDRMLKDIGLSRADAQQIAGCKFWDDSLRSEQRYQHYHRQ